MTTLPVSAISFDHFAFACTLPLIELDAEARIGNWNPAATRLFGYSKQEVLGRHPADFLCPRAPHFEDNPSWSILSEPGQAPLALPVVLSCINKQGHHVICEWRFTEIMGETPAQTRRIILIEDITDRERTNTRIAQLISEQDALLDNTVFGAAFLTNDRILRCNETFATLCGYQIHEVIRRPFAHFLADPDYYAYFANEVLRAIEHDGHWDGDITLQRKYGSTFWASLRISPLAIPLNGRTLSPQQMEKRRDLIVIMQDITSRREQQQQIQRLLVALETERERAMITLQAIADAVIRVDIHGHIEFANTVALQILGLREMDLLGYSLPECLTLRHPQTLKHLDLMNPDLAGHTEHGESVHHENRIGLWRDADDHERAIEFSLSLLNGQTGADDPTGMVMVFRDVTEQRRLSEELSWQARHDALTKLPNRHSFELRVELALEGVRKLNQQHVVLFLDLDRFKIVNDTCGHAAGDELLKQLTLLMQAKVRKSDMLARMGGDEFAVILDSCDYEQAGRVAESLRQVVQDFRFIWQDKVFRVGVSIGAVVLDRHEQTLEDVFSCADYACYAAKELGRNRVNFYTPGDHSQNQGKQEMEWLPRIHAALEQNRFELDLQLIMPTTQDQAVWHETHYEVLVRMIDEQGQRVPPMSFIPPAERYGLMGQIDRWVVTEIFNRGEMLLTEHGQSFNSLLCVNLSGHSIVDDSLIQFIQLRLSAYPRLAKHLCFEITETAAVSNLTRAASLMQSIKALGARFALDDFGSGMSSFAYLRTLPVDFLKIDGVFIKNLVEDPINRAMVSGIHHVGQTMGLKTIAEFVENQAIVSQLREIGVDYVQGYALHRPERFDLVAAQWMTP
ncbi:bifunctional diguanylate cyclase/phosphodiesterase [Parvibium lacunae]|uniref:EAL domain-containing protein n=1 Tax=Parvibium lacunae TaxID=1888893 RepID=A0A368L7V9_9BURK|nr:EAL domain-containing protein [Parvibium lacunae]RCS59694.1 EAL domain-containing protein [Parvibium lacunae]